MSPRVRVLVVDDHPTFRSGLRAILSTDPVIEVVAEASSGEQALELAGEANPDVVLMDLSMPGMGGVATTARLLESAHPPRVLVMTMTDADASVFASLRAGALGYLLKDAAPEEILSAIHAVAEGRAALGARPAERMLSYFAGPAARAARPFPQLSDREREVLDLLAAGRDNAHIAATLFLSPKTVRNHISNIIAKLQVPDRAQAIIVARDSGFGR